MARQPSEGRWAYEDIREEMGGSLTLDDLEPEMVEKARAWAKRSHQKWPPRPSRREWQVRIIKLR